MSSSDAGHDWDDSYAGEAPPWDIGRPQAAFGRLAEAGALTGDLLDAGCGTGEHALVAAQHGARALGIDISARAIEAARAKAAERGVDATFQVFDVLRLEDLGPSFDTVIDSGCLHVFDLGDRAAYVAGLHAVLRPGGRLHLMCFSDSQPGDWGPHRFAEEELRAVFADGWRIERAERDRFEINPVEGVTAASAWRLEAVRD